jgi:hypothetical protein
MAEDEQFLGGLLGKAFPEQASPDGTTFADHKSEWRSLALNMPAPTPSSPTSPTDATTATPLAAVLADLLSHERSLKRSVNGLGLEQALAIIVERYGKPAVRQALSKVRGKRLRLGVYILRHALALFCEKFGCSGDWSASEALAPFFPSNRIDTFGERRRGSICKLLQQARKQCANAPRAATVAREQADEWYANCRTDSVSLALRSLNRNWKNSTPF